jgi:hypothetical protein
MKILAARFLIPVAVLALAACAAKHWSKEGANPEQLGADEKACQVEAYKEVRQQQSKSVSTMGPAVVGPTSRRSTSPSGPFADQRGTQLADEDHLVAECMRAKGYEKVRK